MQNFARIFYPDCLDSLICALYYIRESLFGTFCRPKYSTVRLCDGEILVIVTELLLLVVTYRLVA